MRRAFQADVDPNTLSEEDREVYENTRAQLKAALRLLSEELYATEGHYLLEVGGHT